MPNISGQGQESIEYATHEYNVREGARNADWIVHLVLTCSTRTRKRVHVVLVEVYFNNVATTRYTFVTPLFLVKFVHADLHLQFSLFKRTNLHMPLHK